MAPEAPSEWEDPEPHTLIVTSVMMPTGPLDDGELEYEIRHLPTCPQEEGEYRCAVAHNADDGLAFTLRYSGTPITTPGTYQIKAWGRKHYVWEAWAYEYDGGIGVCEPEESEP